MKPIHILTVALVSALFCFYLVGAWSDAELSNDRRISYHESKGE